MTEARTTAHARPVAPAVPTFRAGSGVPENLGAPRRSARYCAFASQSRGIRFCAFASQNRGGGLRAARLGPARPDRLNNALRLMRAPAVGSGRDGRPRGALGAKCPTALPCGLGKDAGAPFTFHGHRLSSLYRGSWLAGLPFIFLKIRKILSSVAGEAIAYLEKDERAGGMA